MQGELISAGDRRRDSDLCVFSYGAQKENWVICGLPMFCDYDQLPAGILAGLTDVFVTDLARSQIGTLQSVVIRHFAIFGKDGPRLRLHGPRGLDTRWNLMIEKAPYKEHPEFYVYTEGGEQAFYQKVGDLIVVATPFEVDEDSPAYVGYHVQAQGDPEGVIIIPGMSDRRHVESVRLNADAVFVEKTTDVLVMDLWKKDLTLERIEQLAESAGAAVVRCSNGPKQYRGRTMQIKTGYVHCGASEPQMQTA